MSNNITTSSDALISQRTNTYAATVMLAHAAPVMILEKTANNVRMPKNKGANISWRRPVPFTAATTPLVEGVTPNGRKFEFETITAALRQYGDWSTYTDVIADLHEDPVGQQISVMHGENIGRTFEALDWGTVQGGTGMVYANGAARNAVNTPVTITLVRSVVRTLLAQKAMYFTSVLSGSAEFSTFPIEAAFIAMGHTNLASDIRNLPGFIPAAQYGSKRLIDPREIGSVEDVRFVLSPDLEPFTDDGGTFNGSGTAMLSTGGTSADVYSLMFFGKDAWGRVAPRIGSGGEMPISVRHRMPNGEISDSDPLAQRGQISWKGHYDSVILNENWLVRAEVAATAL